MRLDSFFSRALCVLSGGRLPEALFMVFLLDSKGASMRSLLALSEQSAVCTFFSLLPSGLAALVQSAGFFSGVVFFARMTLARSASHGFQIRFKRCKSV